MIKLCFKKLVDDAIVPSIKNQEDAGLDLHSVEEGTIFKGSTGVFSTGLSLEILWNLSPQIKPYDFPEYAETYYQSLNNDYSFAHNQWLINNFIPYLHVVSRSGLATKGIHVGAGIIDWGYRGELKIILHNISNIPFDIKKGDRIAQGIVRFKPTTEIEVVEDLSETIRGTNGFGSSGV